MNFKNILVAVVIAGIAQAAWADDQNHPDAAELAAPLQTDDIAAILAVSQSSEGASAPAKSTPSLTLEERNHAQEESRLLREIRLLDLQLDVASRREKLRGDSITVQATAATSAPPSSVLSVSKPEPFRVMTIWGDGTDMRADILVNGKRRSVRHGEAVHDGWNVAEIRPSELDIRKGNQSRTIAVGH